MTLSEEWARREGFQRRKGEGIPAGKQIERAAFGMVTEPMDGWMSFSDAITYAKEHQPSLLKRPRIATELCKLVAQHASNKNEPVKFYTALGTPLDGPHGVDAFFEQNGVRVTIDISAREKDVHKADVLLVASMDEEGRVVVSDAELEGAARKIARELSDASRKRKRLHRG